MFRTVSQSTLHQALLSEVATSGAFADSIFVVYAVLGVLAVACLASAYLVFGRKTLTP